MKMSTPVIGISLGAKDSCVAVYQHGKVVIIANEHGKRTTPCYVSFKEGEQLVGEVAKNNAIFNSRNTIYDINRLIGRRFNEEAIQTYLKCWPFTVVGCDGFAKIQVTYEDETVLFAPEEISAMILSKLKDTAEAYLEQRISRAVITVPAYFNDYQKQATIAAGEMAGLEVMYVLTEPVAAVITYAVENNNIEGTVLVFDIERSTLEVSIVYIHNKRIVLKSISGSTAIGGEDFTNNLVNYVVNLFRNKYNTDLSSNKLSLARLKQECERAKTRLSFEKETVLFLDLIIDGLDLAENITRAKFNELNDEKFIEILQHAIEALNYANMTPKDIDKVIMIGGSSSIPKLEYLLQDYFGYEKIFKFQNSEEAKAYGAGTYATKFMGINFNDSDFFMKDVIEYCTLLKKCALKGASYGFKAMVSNIIGIDLGLDYSRVAVYDHGKIEVLTNNLGSNATPCWVTYCEEDLLVGELAKKQAEFDPENTVYGMRRLIGRQYSETIQQANQHWPFTIGYDEQKFFRVKVKWNNVRKVLKPEDITAIILKKMRETAESYLNRKVTEAVITVPAYFDNCQRRATINAGKLAGLEVVRLLTEPIAAALAYAVTQNAIKGNVVVFNLGKETIDASIVNIIDSRFVVTASKESAYLGGDDFSRKLFDYIISLVHQNFGENISKPSIDRIKRESERAIKQLSFNFKVTIYVENVINGKDFSKEITRPKFNELNSDLFDLTLEPIKDAMEVAKITRRDVEKVILVGESSHIPKIQEKVRQFFDSTEICASIEPDEVVRGAALYTAINDGIKFGIDNFTVGDIVPRHLSIGHGKHSEVLFPIIKGNSVIPISVIDILYTLEDNQTVARFSVYEGDSSDVKANILLGELILRDIPCKPAGIEKFQVIFDIDSNGILKVGVTNISTRIKSEITIGRRIGCKYD